MSVQLVQRAISEYYHEHQWLLINLKNCWITESSWASTRHSLKLSEYATVEIVEYNTEGGKPTYQVYIILTYKLKQYPENLYCIFDTETTYEEIVKRIHDMLTNARNTLINRLRGINYNIKDLV